MKEIQHKITLHAIEVKASEGESKTLHIKAYACVFGNVDSYGDIIEAGACDKFLQSEEADRMKLCYQHDYHEVIGVITDKGVDAIGMWIEADILDTATGVDVQKLIKAGAINEFSIGYYTDKYRYEKREGYDYELRILEEITIAEVSPVTRAANPKAILLDMKSEDGKRALEALGNDEFEALRKAVNNEFARRVLANL